MKNVYKLVDRAVQECMAIGIQVGYIDDVKINRRAKARWGLCSKNRFTGKYTIEISNRLLDDSVSDTATMNTVVHEVLHTVDGCMNHGALWKKYASMVNRRYGYNVKRTTSANEKGLQPCVADSTAKYTVTCEKCGRTHNYAREGKVVKILKGELWGSCRCCCGSKHLTLTENY